MEEGEKSVYDHEQKGFRPIENNVPKPKNAYQLFCTAERQKISTAEPSCVCIPFSISVLLCVVHALRAHYTSLRALPRL